MIRKCRARSADGGEVRAKNVMRMRSQRAQPCGWRYERASASVAMLKSGGVSVVVGDRVHESRRGRADHVIVA